MNSRQNSVAAGRATIGTVALLAAFMIAALQVIGSAQSWASLIAILLAIMGIGLRIEAAISRT